MNKYIAYTAILFCLSSWGSKADLGQNSGFTIGQNLGYTSFDSVLIHDFSPSYGGVCKNHIGGSSPNIGFFLGYGFSQSDTGIYIGSEIFAQYENIEINNKILDIETTIKDNSSFGACVKIGYIYKDYLFFLKSGVVSMGNMRKGLSIRKKGILLGGGLDLAMNREWSIGTEFIYERYSSIEGSIPSYVTLNYEPRKLVSNIRLKYSF